MGIDTWIRATNDWTMDRGNIIRTYDYDYDYQWSVQLFKRKFWSNDRTLVSFDLTNPEILISCHRSFLSSPPLLLPLSPRSPEEHPLKLKLKNVRIIRFASASDEGNRSKGGQSGRGEMRRNGKRGYRIVSLRCTTSCWTTRLVVNGISTEDRSYRISRGEGRA